MINKKVLISLYLNKKLSSKEISKIVGCSESKINYWLKKYSIQKRTISESVYLKNNPKEPFKSKNISSGKEWFLFGLGLGLYWGEGTKVDKYSVRIGNSDPDLLLCFREFLIKIYKIDQGKIRYGLQIFSDINPKEALYYWSNKMNVSLDKFYKPTITISGKVGNYKNKNKYGVLTLYFNNSRLARIIKKEVEKLRK